MKWRGGGVVASGVIRLLTVACRMSAHSSSAAVLSCWILEGTGTRRRTRPTQSIANRVSGWHVVSMLAVLKWGCSQLVYRSLQHGAVHYHAATWGGWRRMNGTTRCLRNSSRHLRAFKLLSVQHLWHCVDKIAHFRVDFCCDQHAAHLYNNYAA